MADVNKVEGQEPTTNEEGNQNPAEAGANPEPKNEGDGGPDLFEGIPDDHPVRKEVTKLRNENASRRQAVHERDTLVDELKGKLADAKTPEEVKSLTDDYEKKLADKDLAITRKDVARDFGLPKKVEDALQGQDLESLRAEAQEWQELFGPKKPAPLTPTGGRTPAGPREDVTSMAKSIRARRQ
ncbi:hypothetical protein [Glutamicibacter creatinolyticus]|uniref:hypothetical protein n=1 Tax=Glutamicibacter creatinolyticus TaxID=162496 RepID=UPI00321753E1